MICDQCNEKEAIFHSMKIINGIQSERHLCASCQSKLSNRVSAAKNLAQLFSSFSALSEASVQATAKQKREVKSCSNCGIAITQVLKDGFLGCPECYDTFIDVLLPMISKVQSGTTHKGKSPFVAKTKSSIELEIEHLRQELLIVVDAERYEEAAVIQNKIRGLLEKKDGKSNNEN